MGTSNTAAAPPIIRLAHPLAFTAFLKHVGAPTERHLRRQGLPALCDDPDKFVPLRRAWAFFDATAQREDPMLGWYAGRFVGDNNLNDALLRKLESAPTLYQALKRLIRMVSAEASHLQLGILGRRDDILFYTHYSNMKDLPGYTSSQAYQLEAYLDLIRHFVGQQWVPDEIGIEIPIVPSVAEEHFPGSRILTHQQVGYIAVPRSCLHMAARNRDSDATRAEPLALTKKFDYVDTLRVLLEAYLAEGYPSTQLAASLMETSVRTLARRLTAAGVTYRTLVDEVRFNAARKLLQETGAPISGVSSAIGFDDPAHFARMFRRVGGLSPRAFRQATQRVE